MTKEKLLECQSLLQEVAELERQIEEIRQQKAYCSDFARIVRDSRIKALSQICDNANAVLQEVYDALAKLPSIERRLLEMRYLQGMQWQPIASALRFSVDHVSGYLHNKALEHLKVNKP